METLNNYIVLARKYRPTKLSELIGQEEICNVIKGSIQLNRVPHAFLFSGTRGIGKTSVARILAKIVNCTSLESNLFDPCQKCDTCISIDNESNMDVVEIDAASRTGVSDVREIIENINYKPLSSKKKIYIIDEVHMLSKAAFNALLKTLEEPPPDVLFVFATTEIEKIPVTILSRCQRFQLRRVGAEKISRHLVDVAKKEGYKIDEESAMLIAQCSEGSVRDSLSILDNVLVRDKSINLEIVRAVLGLSDNTLVIDLFENLFIGDVKECLKKFNEIYDKGVSLDLLAKDLMKYSYHIARLKALVDSNNQFTDSKTIVRLKEISKKYDMDFIIRFWELMQKYVNEISNIFDERQCFEMLVIRLCYVSILPTPFEGLNKKNPLKSYEKEKTDDQKKDQKLSDSFSNQKKSESDTFKFKESLNSKITSPNEINLEKFSFLVKKIEELSEMVISFHLKSSFRLVNLIEPIKNKGIGIIELENISENINEKSILWKTSKILQKITGNRWVISIVKSQGTKSIAENENLETQKKIDRIKNDDLIKKFLEMIPSSEVVSIKEIKEEETKEKDKGKNVKLISNNETS